MTRIIRVVRLSHEDLLSVPPQIPEREVVRYCVERKFGYGRTVVLGVNEPFSPEEGYKVTVSVPVEQVFDFKARRFVTIPGRWKWCGGNRARTRAAVEGKS